MFLLASYSVAIQNDVTIPTKELSIHALLNGDHSKVFNTPDLDGIGNRDWHFRFDIQKEFDKSIDQYKLCIVNVSQIAYKNIYLL